MGVEVEHIAIQDMPSRDGGGQGRGGGPSTKMVESELSDGREGMPKVAREGDMGEAKVATRWFLAVWIAHSSGRARWLSGLAR